LSGLITTFTKSIGRAAKHGKKFRFVVMNPENTAVLLAASYSRVNESKRMLKQKISDSLHALDELQKESLKNNTEQNIVYKKTNVVLNNLYFIANPQSEDGRMIVEMYAYKISADNRYKHFLTYKQDQELFNYHREIFTAIWEDALP
jgi:hypothetical protein